jgi:hypothetical protein
VKEAPKHITTEDAQVADLKWSYRQFLEILGLLNRTAQGLTHASDKEIGYITLGMAIAKTERGVQKLEPFAVKPEETGDSSDESS